MGWRTSYSEIAKIEPQAAYTCFIIGYKHKLNRIYSGYYSWNYNYWTWEKAVIFSTPTRRTGYINIWRRRNRISKFHHDIRTLCNRITDQFKRHEPDAELNKKKQTNSMKKDRQKNILDIIRNHMSSGERKQNDLNLETGASSWLTTLPIKEEGYILNKQSFWVLLSIRYGYRLKRIPSNCACGNTFNLQHALQCPKSGFLS